MLMVKIEAEANGARANQRARRLWKSIPEGWVLIPQELEESAAGYLPWLSLTLEEGQVTAVACSQEAREAWERQQAEENGSVLP